MEEGRQVAAPALLKAAFAYAGRGVPVFPCEPGAKRLLMLNGHWDATTDRRAIGRWWRRWPTANVGLPTGKKSGIVVLDMDVDDGGSESLAKLERAGAPVPKTARTRTGGCGIHVFFRYPGTTEIRNSAGLSGPGLDVRGEGGYVVVPPSRTRGPYEWVDRSPLAESSWLIDRLAEREEAALFRGASYPPEPRSREDDRPARLQPLPTNQLAASRAIPGGTTWPPSNSR